MEQINSPHSFTFLDWGMEDITFQYEPTSLGYHGWGGGGGGGVAVCECVDRGRGRWLSVIVL